MSDKFLLAISRPDSFIVITDFNAKKLFRFLFDRLYQDIVLVKFINQIFFEVTLLYQNTRLTISSENK